jgi:Tfp pilus assembly protein PilE
MSAPGIDGTMETEGHGGVSPRVAPPPATEAAASTAKSPDYTMTIAKTELTEAKTELDKAEAKLEKAKTELEKAKTELEKAKGTDGEGFANKYYATVLAGVETAQRGIDTASKVVAAATDQLLAVQKRGRTLCEHSLTFFAPHHTPPTFCPNRAVLSLHVHVFIVVGQVSLAVFFSLQSTNQRAPHLSFVHLTFRLCTLPPPHPLPFDGPHPSIRWLPLLASY